MLFVLAVVKKGRRLSMLLTFFVIVLRLGGKERCVRKVNLGRRLARGRNSRSCLVPSMLRLRRLTKFDRNFNLSLKLMRR